MVTCDADIAVMVIQIAKLMVLMSMHMVCSLDEIDWAILAVDEINDGFEVLLHGIGEHLISPKLCRDVCKRREEMDALARLLANKVVLHSTNRRDISDETDGNIQCNQHLARLSDLSEIF
jgi:hypothetical protein